MKTTNKKIEITALNWNLIDEVYADKFRHSWQFSEDVSLRLVRRREM